LKRTISAPEPYVVREHYANVAVGRDGTIDLTDPYAGTVTKLSSSGKLVARWGRERGPGHLDTPQGVAVDAEGHVYVADASTNTIKEYSADGSFLTFIGREGSGPGQLDSPNGVAVDDLGNVYVADTGNNRIEKFSPTTWIRQQQRPDLGLRSRVE
jgi:DNA-binding beta-propeller fold protein YncE